MIWKVSLRCLLVGWKGDRDAKRLWGAGGNVSLAIDGSLGGQLGFKVARELPSRPAARATKQ